MRLTVGRRAARRRPLFFDGAMGTELIARGLDLAVEPPEAWLLRRPEVVGEVHAAHLAAGASTLQTNTFGGSRPRLERAGLGDRTAEIQHLAVALARGAGPGQHFVVASLGPTGIDPFAAGAAALIAAAYQEQIAALLAAGVDGLHFETMYHPLEATAGLTVARRLTALPVFASATYALGDLGYQTPLGVPLAAMTAALEEAGADALGVNCSLEARKMVGLVGKLRQLTDLPLLVQPQGAPTETDCRAPRVTNGIDAFARAAPALLDAGADLLGGCCGATPAHIAALVAQCSSLSP